MTSLPAGEFFVPARPAERSPPRERGAIEVFRGLLATYTVLALTKIHEIVPLMDRLQPAKVIGVLLLVSALTVIRGRALVTVLRTPAVACVGVILLLAILSVPGAVWPGNSVAFLTQEFWKTLLFFVIAMTGWCDRRTLRTSLRTLVVFESVVAVTLLAGAAKVLGGRAYVGQALDPNESAVHLLVVIPFALQLVSDRGIWKIVGIAGTLLMVGGIVKTGSRAGFLGLVLLACWLLVQVPGRRRVIVGLAIASGAAVVMLTAGPAIRERFSTILHPTEDYNYTFREGRVNVWKRGLSYMARRPFLGVGAQNFGVAEGVLSGKENVGYGVKYSAAHNVFIQVGAELGVFGLVAFVRLLWVAAAASRRLRKVARQLAARGVEVARQEASLAEAALGGMVALLVGGFFLSIAYEPITFFVVAVCVALRLGTPLRQWPQAVAA
ncbi:MAG TPA: O-antigen ligase family protein [Gemmatimonadales bacterium]|nr:O-antigen ligase family protein [Gemmatimonadales bacterium]